MFDNSRMQLARPCKNEDSTLLLFSLSCIFKKITTHFQRDPQQSLMMASGYRLMRWFTDQSLLCAEPVCCHLTPDNFAWVLNTLQVVIYFNCVIYKTAFFNRVNLHIWGLSETSLQDQWVSWEYLIVLKNQRSGQIPYMTMSTSDSVLENTFAVKYV